METAMDPKSIWKNQPTEHSTMTLELIRSKARELHIRTRRDLIKQITVPVFVTGFCIYQIVGSQNFYQRAACVVAIVWAFIGAWFLNRGMWSAPLPGDAGLATGIEFYRQEVERRRYLFQRVLQWSFGPVVLAVAAFTWPLLAMGNPKMLPFLILLVLWFVAVFFLRAQARHDLQREMDDLRKLT
jgi:hypothetical protein